MQHLNRMRLRNSWLFRIGLAFLLLGGLPLPLFLLAMKLGFIADPAPNPIGLGLLFYVSLPIGAILIQRARSRLN